MLAVSENLCPLIYISHSSSPPSGNHHSVFSEKSAFFFFKESTYTWCVQHLFFSVWLISFSREVSLLDCIPLSCQHLVSWEVQLQNSAMPSLRALTSARGECAYVLSHQLSSLTPGIAWYMLIHGRIYIKSVLTVFVLLKFPLAPSGERRGVG